MHSTDFLIDVDVTDPAQVASASTLNIGINDGIAVNNLNTIGANRLLIFTGTAINPGIVGHDDNLARGVFRVRLRFPLRQSLIFKAAATIAALAGLHGEEDEDQTFDTNAAVTVTDPTDGGTLPQPAPPLPDNELYTIIDAAYQGDGCILARVCYQANVLVQDLEPDLQSILVGAPGTQEFSPSFRVSLAAGQTAGYDLQVNLTGPVQPDNSPFLVHVQSDAKNVPLTTDVPLISPASSAVLPNNGITGTGSSQVVTLTGTGKHTSATATLFIDPIT